MRDRPGLTGRGPQPLRRQLIIALLAAPALLAIGTLGYMAIEGWSFFDALFMAATTITTVGYGEVRPLSTPGRAFTIGLLIAGLAALWYALSLLVRVALEGELGARWEERRMERHVEHHRDHQIVAGFGRVGRQTALALRDLGQTVVVIDAAPAAIEDAKAAGFDVVAGNAAEDATLIRAGIARAAGLIAALGQDADNVFVTLSARALQPSLPIVARANERASVPKLIRAGAMQAVSPYSTAGRQMARLAVRPRTVEFIENLFGGPSATLVVEDVRIDAGSPLVGRTVREVQALAPEVLCVAVRRGGETLAPPASDLRLTIGDEIAVIGPEENLRSLEAASQGAPPGDVREPGRLPPAADLNDRGV
jgi:voltage-gated potassium channel